MKNFIKTMAILWRFDQKKGKNPDWQIIAGNVFKSLTENKPIQLISFTCSTVNSRYLFSDTPEKYISLNPQGNNLEDGLPILKLLINEFRKEKIPLKVIILIGNTDPFYIYTQEGKTTPYSQQQFFKKFNSRWKIYRKKLDLWLESKLPKKTYEVLSWYEVEKEWEEKNQTSFLKSFSKTRREIDQYFKPGDFKWELNRLKEAFGPGQYFERLKRPFEKTLKIWIERKFAEYAVQGLWIKQIWPEVILIQNEKPTDLRYKMYQPLIKEIYQSRLPNIYPYGIDNLGFQ